ncbi:MAG: 4Fe-4S dicluster domain-containing protein [Desulfohalobiaceae bacterium]|nr:4Fe-4S dicluster domain-containing protein [Desulfohalobiaceae bacterium]
MNIQTHTEPILLNPSGNELSREIRSIAGTDFNRCFQCQSCSGGCPFFQSMDLGPHKIMRLLQLGLCDQALRSTTIWICVGCHTCDNNCPMAVDIPMVMDLLRQKAVERGVRVQNPEILDFHQEILSSIYRYGRTHKLEIMLRYKARRKNWLQDWDLGLRMLAKKKLDLLPSKVQIIEEVHKAFGRNSGRAKP